MEEVRAVLGDAVDHHRRNDEEREREGDDDMARHREPARNHAEQVEHEHEHEEREDEGEELHPLIARRASDRTRDDFIGDFRKRLQATGHQSAGARARQHQQGDRTDGSEHEDARIGQRDIVGADLAEGRKGLDLELLNRIGHRRSALLVPPREERRVTRMFIIDPASRTRI